MATSGSTSAPTLQISIDDPSPTPSPVPASSLDPLARSSLSVVPADGERARTDSINALPTELLEPILQLAIPLEGRSFALQKLQRGQAEVCRRWYELRVERTRVVIISIGQVRHLTELLREDKERAGGIRSVVMDGPVDREGLNSIGEMVDLCPQLTIFRMLASRVSTLLDDSHLWTSLMRCDLEEFELRSDIGGIKLFEALDGWPNLATLSLGAVYIEGASPRSPPRPLHHLHSCTLTLIQSSAFHLLQLLKTVSSLRRLHLMNLSTLDLDPALTPLIPGLEHLSFAQGNCPYDVESVLLLGTRLTSLTLGGGYGETSQGYTSFSFIPSLTELKELTLWVHTETKLDLLEREMREGKFSLLSLKWEGRRVRIVAKTGSDENDGFEAGEHGVLQLLNEQGIEVVVEYF